MYTVNILLICWARWSKCCNCFKGQMCNGERCTDCDNGCCCRYFCKHEPCCVHFPNHHRQYVKWTAMTVAVLVGAELGASIQQIYYSTSYVDVSSEYELWLLYFNVVSAIKSVLGAMAVYWTFYYQLCFYWSRDNVNEHENVVIMDIISEFFEGGYIFKVSVDEEEDKFIKVDNNASVENVIYHKKDCFTYCLYCNAFISAPLTIIPLMYYTTFLNGDVSDPQFNKF